MGTQRWRGALAGAVVVASVALGACSGSDGTTLVVSDAGAAPGDASSSVPSVGVVDGGAASTTADASTTLGTDADTPSALVPTATAVDAGSSEEPPTTGIADTTEPEDEGEAPDEVDSTGPTATTLGPAAVLAAPTGFTLTVGARLDPCTHEYAHGAIAQGACYEVTASWDDPGDPEALWNLVPPSAMEFRPDVATLPLGPAHYEGSDGRISRTFAVTAGGSQCVKLAVYHARPSGGGFAFTNGSDFAHACVTTPA